MLLAGGNEGHRTGHPDAAEDPQTLQKTRTLRHCRGQWQLQRTLENAGENVGSWTGGTTLHKTLERTLDVNIRQDAGTDPRR